VDKIVNAPKGQQVKVDLHTARLIHYVNCARMGLQINYDDLSAQDVKDMEYIYLKFKHDEKQKEISAILEGFAKIMKGSLGG
jgi:hypothetical protein